MGPCGIKSPWNLFYKFYILSLLLSAILLIYLKLKLLFQSVLFVISFIRISKNCLGTFLKDNLGNSLEESAGKSLEDCLGGISLEGCLEGRSGALLEGYSEGRLGVLLEGYLEGNPEGRLGTSSEGRPRVLVDSSPSSPNLFYL